MSYDDLVALIIVLLLICFLLGCLLLKATYLGDRDAERARTLRMAISRHRHGTPRCDAERADYELWRAIDPSVEVPDGEEEPWRASLWDDTPTNNDWRSSLRDDD